MRIKILIYFVLFSANSLHAKEFGIISKVIGSVFKIPFGQVTEVKISYGDNISSKDTLITKDKSIVVVKLIDGSIFSFAPNTKFTFNEMEFTEKKKRSIDFDLVYGKIRGIVAKAPEGENKVNINTHSVSMGIRGTEILLNHKLENGKKEYSEAALMSGVAEIRYKNSGKIYRLKPGDYLVATLDWGKQLKLKTEVYEALASIGAKAYKYNQKMEDNMMLAGSLTGKDSKDSRSGESEIELTDGYFLAGPGMSALEKIQERDIKSDYLKLKKRNLGN